VAVVEQGPDWTETCFGGCLDPVTVEGGSSEYMVFEMDSGDVDSYEYDTATSAYVNEPIEAYYVTRWFAPGNPDMVKRGLWAELAIGSLGYGSMALYLGSDFSPNFARIKAANVTGSTTGSKWGECIWNYPSSGGSQEPRPDFAYWSEGTSAYGLVRVALKNLHKIFRFKLYDNGNTRFEVSGMITDFRLKGNRA